MPRSPYAAAKVYSYWIVRNYREAYGLYSCNGILFNHESPRRGETFVTRKITKAVARIANRKQEKITLGNLDSRRDWGYAPEYVKGMWMMLQQPNPDDFVLATGESHTVREFVEKAFACVGIKVGWHNKGVEEEGFDAKNGKVIIKIDPSYYRPTEVDHLLGNAGKARTQLGWKPTTKFHKLVELMVESDLAADKSV
jgi:GDPmannose 4,6-dehydratase